MTTHEQNPRPTFLALVLRLIYIAGLLTVGFLVYQYLIRDVIDDNGRALVPIIGIWLFTAYIFLPRIHRWFSKIYLPNYFIGRVRTYDGLLGDPVNIAINGSRKQLISAMKSAGWTQADDLNWRTTILMTRSSILGKSYPQAPVSSLFLFNRKQDLAFQMEVDNNPRKRHHVRFWATPKQWWLPGGYSTDWLGAATYDRRVGLSGLTLQITHKIAENTDEERDFLVGTMKSAHPKAKVTIVQHFTRGYHDKNGGGDRIRTDGSLPFIDLTEVKK